MPAGRISTQSESPRRRDPPSEPLGDRVDRSRSHPTEDRKETVKPQEQLDAAKKLIDENLVQACREIIEWHDTSILCQGIVRQAAELLEFDRHHNLGIVESMVDRAALEYVRNRG